MLESNFMKAFSLFAGVKDELTLVKFTHILHFKPISDGPLGNRVQKVFEN